MLRLQKYLLLLVSVIGCATGCNYAANQIRVLNISAITVNRGHAVIVATNAYKIIYDKSKYADCLAYVTSTPTFSCGTLSPDVFNCSSVPDLSYTHYGCDRDKESIDLALSLTSLDQNAVKTEHFTIEVTVMSVTDHILRPSDKIIVPAESGKALVSLNISDNSECEYAIVSPITLPYYGNVGGPIKQWLSCNSSQSLEYTLIDHEWYQPEDRIVIAIRNNGSVSYEQLPVIIERPNDIMTSCMLEEGVVLTAEFNCYTPVNDDNLISHNCSFARDWKFEITQDAALSSISMLMSHGQHLTTTTFTFGQLKDGMVAYHRKSSLQSPRTYHYRYSVYDVYGRKIFNNSITTRNTAASRLVEIYRYRCSGRSECSNHQ